MQALAHVHGIVHEILTLDDREIRERRRTRNGMSRVRARVNVFFVTVLVERIRDLAARDGR